MERARDLLEDAEDFLGAARDLLRSGRWAKVCFNAQQAGEMALKAALNKYGVERRTHSLTELLEELIRYGERLEGLRDAAKVLDQYYIPTRYANAFSSGPAYRHYTRRQAEEAVELAEAILREVRRIVTEGEAEKEG